jgi:hypothetical protein
LRYRSSASKVVEFLLHCSSHRLSAVNEPLTPDLGDPPLSTISNAGPEVIGEHGAGVPLFVVNVIV